MKKFYHLTVFIILAISFYMIPTEKLLTDILIYITKIDNKNFINLLKLAILLLIVFFMQIDLKSSIKYGKIYNFKITKFDRNPLKYIIILIFGIEFLVTAILIILDLKGIFIVSSDSWMQYITGFMGTVLASISIIASAHKYFIDKEERESPKIAIEGVKKPDKVEYYWNLPSSNDNNINIRKIYIKISNNGSSPIKNLSLKQYYFYEEYWNFITENNEEMSIELSPNKQIMVEVDAIEIEGMSHIVEDEFLLMYSNDENNFDYEIRFRARFNRRDENENVKLECNKQVRNYDDAVG